MTADATEYLDRLTQRHVGVKIKEERQNKYAAPLRYLVADKDFSKGDLVFIDEGNAVAIHPQILSTNSFCHHCFQPMTELGDPDATHSCNDCYGNAVFCSSDCLKSANREHHKVLCTENTENPAAKALWHYCVQNGTVLPYMMARFVAKMIWKQTASQTERQKRGDGSQPEIMEEWDHLERLPTKVSEPTKEDEIESKLVRQTVSYAAPGAVEFLTLDRYVAMKACFAMNSFALTAKDFNASVKSKEQLKSDAPKAEQIGACLNFVAAYLSTEGGDPNVEMTFTYRENKSPFVVVRASTDIEKGERLVVQGKPKESVHTSEE